MGSSCLLVLFFVYRFSIKLFYVPDIFVYFFSPVHYSPLLYFLYYVYIASSYCSISCGRLCPPPPPLANFRPGQGQVELHTPVHQHLG